MADFDWKNFIGGGAFGKVWVAFDKAVGEERAVKVFPQSSVIDPGNFYAEAHALSALQHDNIVAVKDAGTLPPSTVYIAMELLTGGSVADRLDGRALNIRDSSRLAADACRGLEFAHHNGYVHRDIKPANILIGKRGEGKLGDFGIAARVTPLDRPAGVGYTTHCSPEMLTDDTASNLSDIYAMGVTLYRMVNALSAAEFHALVPGNVDAAIIAGRFPSRNRYRWSVPRALKTVINKAMNVDPAKRHRSAAELRHALEQQVIMCEWEDRSTASREIYVTKEADFVAEINAQETRTGDWVVTFRRCVPGGSLRTVSKFTRAFSDRAIATTYARKLALLITCNG